MLPNFFIIGAPKCGTTSLARWLEAHPQVFVSPIKEPHYHSTDLTNRSITSEAAYRRLFDGAEPRHIAVGEASTWYLFSREAVPNILQMAPRARLIVMTRDPVEMARSLHHHNLRALNEDESDFARAWDLQVERRGGPAYLQYGAACSLGAQVARLLDHAPPEQVLHIPLEELRRDPAFYYRRVLAFLEVSDDGREAFPLANAARGHRSQMMQRALRFGYRFRLALGMRRGLGLARFNERKQEKAPLDPSFSTELSTYFSDDQALLHTAITNLSVAKADVAKDLYLPL